MPDVSATDPLTPEALAALRVEYSMSELDERFVQPDPLAQLGNWLAEARAARVTEPNAMVLGTVSPDGQPSTRTVLLKALDATGLTFFTNYQSHKARDIEVNDRVSATFLWADLQRQVHVHGRAEKTAFSDSEAYFQTRPYLSQLGAHASPQSSVLPSREWLEKRFAELEARFPKGRVPAPAHWGGYRIVPTLLEFWQGRRSRLHDRVRYTPCPEESTGWRIERLSP
ncbi:MAG: pyridoxamine 5'-phosphate oxidase [Verrucomicrobiales bacterium]